MAKDRDSGPLDMAAAILRKHLPAFQVRVLGAYSLPSGLSDPISVQPKIAVELPMDHADLRLGLLEELSQRTGLPFSSDRRSIDGACTSAIDPKKIFDRISFAAQRGKLEGLTIEYLEENTSAYDKAAALEARHRIAPPPGESVADLIKREKQSFVNQLNMQEWRHNRVQDFVFAHTDSPFAADMLAGRIRIELECKGARAEGSMLIIPMQEAKSLIALGLSVPDTSRRAGM